MNIIEKLGIMPIERNSIGPFRMLMCDSEEVQEVEQQNRDMLKALINILKLWEEGAYSPDWMIKDTQITTVIEKATGKSWEEIKELIK